MIGKRYCAKCRDYYFAEAIDECTTCARSFEKNVERANHEVKRRELERSIQKSTNKREFVALMGPVLGILMCISLVGGCVYAFHSIFDSKPKSDTEIAHDQKGNAERKHEGLGCVNGWDGSNSGLEEQVKPQLRDPDSFVHEETIIQPVLNGTHDISMKYRAKNGFGGYEQVVVFGKIDHETCKATITSSE